MLVSQQATVFLIITSRSVGFPDTAFRPICDECFENHPIHCIQARRHSTKMFFLYAATYLVPLFRYSFPCSAPHRISFRLVRRIPWPFWCFLRFPLFFIFYLYLSCFGQQVRHIWGGKLMYACTGRKRKFLRRLLLPGESPRFHRLSNPISGILTSFDRLVD